MVYDYKCYGFIKGKMFDFWGDAYQCSYVLLNNHRTAKLACNESIRIFVFKMPV